MPGIEHVRLAIHPHWRSPQSIGRSFAHLPSPISPLPPPLSPPPSPPSPPPPPTPPAGEHLRRAPGVLCVPAASPQPGAGGVQRSGHPGPQPEAAGGREGVHPAALQIPADPHRDGRGRLR